VRVESYTVYEVIVATESEDALSGTNVPHADLLSLVAGRDGVGFELEAVNNTAMLLLKSEYRSGGMRRVPDLDFASARSYSPAGRAVPHYSDALQGCYVHGSLSSVNVNHRQGRMILGINKLRSVNVTRGLCGPGTDGSQKKITS
jgi:hypothetical protein